MSLFITFEGTEGSGKSTQARLLVGRLQELGLKVIALREPGGTPLGEEIRHILKHSSAGRAMTPETELLLMNASRAQLIREVIRPSLARGEVVVCDRFYDSTIVYQGHGRQMGLAAVRTLIDFAVGETRPDLTLLLHVPLELSERRRNERGAALPDRFEESDRAFFKRVEAGYVQLAKDEPRRVKLLDASRGIDAVAADIWETVKPMAGKLV